MFKNLFLKKKSIEQISFPEVDVALKLMFEMAMIDGTLDKTELELIKKRVREIAPEDTTVSSPGERVSCHCTGESAVTQAVTVLDRPSPTLALNPAGHAS